MKPSHSSVAVGVTALAGALLAVAAFAQEETVAAAAPTTVGPRAAEIAAMAERSLLTRIVRAGDALVAVGARGHILRSQDGQQWQQLAVPVDGLLTSAYFLDAHLGWVVGHDATILHTRDGGTNWTVQHFDAVANQPLLDVLFLDAQRGFAIGAYGLFLETQDGGAQWTPVVAPIVEEQVHFNALVPLGNGSLLIVGEVGMLALSEDRGASWQRLVSPYESSLFAVVAEGERGAVIGGLRGNLYRSADVRAGEWTRIDTGTPQSVFGLAALPGGDIAVAGLNATLLRVAPDNRVQAVPLARAPVAAAPQGPPFVSLATEITDLELGAFSGVISHGEGLITVGDAGIRRWRLGAGP